MSKIHFHAVVWVLAHHMFSYLQCIWDRTEIERSILLILMLAAADTVTRVYYSILCFSDDKTALHILNLLEVSVNFVIFLLTYNMEM